MTMLTETSVRERRTSLWPLAGLPFVGLFLAGFVGATATGTGVFPSPFGDAAGIQRYFTDNHDPVVLMSVTQVCAALALLVFSAYLAGVVREAGGTLHRLVSAAGALASTFLILSGLADWILVRPATLTQPALVRVLHDFTFLTGGPAHVATFGMFAGAASAGALSLGLLPRWIAWLGLAVGAVSAVSVLTVAFEPLAFLLPIGRFLGMIWVISVSVTLLRRRSTA